MKLGDSELRACPRVLGALPSGTKPWVPSSKRLSSPPRARSPSVLSIVCLPTPEESAVLLMRERNKARRSFRLRLTVGLSAIILLIMGVGAAIMIYETVQAIRISAESRGLAFSRSLAMVGGQAVLENLFLIQEALNQQT